MRKQHRIARLLTLATYLQGHPGASVAETSQLFNITQSQLLRDLEQLWMTGLPKGLPGDLIEIDMDAAEQDGVIHLSNADYLDRPMRFTRHEMMSLVVALEVVHDMAEGQPLAQDARSAAAKLIAAAGRDLGQPVLLDVGAGRDEIRSSLAQAIQAAERVQLTYDGFARGETTQPAVDPHSIQMRDGVAYLQAWSVPGEGWRTYHLERIVEVSPTGRPAEHHPQPPSVDTWFEPGGDLTEVVLELSPAAAWVVEYVPTMSSEATSDGGTRVTLAVASTQFLTKLLLRLGDRARVISPAGAGDEAVREARRALELAQRCHN